jgi:hypothetical protein
VKTQAQTVSALSLDQVTKFMHYLVEPLSEVMHSRLAQSVIRLDRVKSSSCDLSATFSVDSNASCFTSFSSGVSSPEIAEFCPTLRLVYAITQA